MNTDTHTAHCFSSREKSTQNTRIVKDGKNFFVLYSSTTFSVEWRRNEASTWLLKAESLDKTAKPEDFSSLGGISSRECETESMPSEVLSQSMKTFLCSFLHARVTHLNTPTATHLHCHPTALTLPVLSCALLTKLKEKSVTGSLFIAHKGLAKSSGWVLGMTCV